MVKMVTPNQLAELVEDLIKVDESEPGYYTLLNAQLQGTPLEKDYPVVRIPRELPVDGQGGFLIPGGTLAVDSCQFFNYGLGLTPCESRFFIKTGHFRQEEGKPPCFTMLHPNESEHIMLHVRWSDKEPPSNSGLESFFGKRTHAVWFHRYDDMYDDPNFSSQDIWVLPTGGVMEPIILQLARRAQEEIDEGEATENYYQEHKAGFRAAIEASGLIERFRKAYHEDEITLELTDDHISINCPRGEDRIRYTARGFQDLNESVERAERLNILVENGALTALLRGYLLGPQA